MRRGFTILELVIALGAGTMVLGCLMALWQLGSKMHRASQSTVALHGALTMTEALFGDLRQMGLDPNSPPYIIGPANRPAGMPGTSLSFFKVAFKPDRMNLVPVRFRTLPSPGGNQYFVREERRGGRVESHTYRPCPVQNVQFDVTTDAWGNDYLRAAITVLEDDRPPGTVTITPDRSVRQQVLVRIPVPDRFGDTAFSKVNVVMKEADLLAP
mgnify:CR=1 FL=1